MEINRPARFRHRKTPSSDRFLGVYLYAPPQNISITPSTEETELNEDDIFSTGDFSESSINHHRQNGNGSSNNNSPPSSTSSTPRNHFHHHQHHNSSYLSPNHKAFQPAKSSGILAALPENKSDSVHHVYQKTTVPSSSSSSASSTSSSRLIPLIPKPPQERVPLSASVSRYHRHHSAPVNVPVLSMAMRRTRNKEFDEIDEDAEDAEEADGEMLPPHEIVARAQSPAVACSVLEGVGRTLKGRDLKQGISVVAFHGILLQLKSSVMSTTSC